MIDKILWWILDKILPENSRYLEENRDRRGKMDSYADVQTGECPVCKATTLIDEWRYGEHNAHRKWVCKCGLRCVKKIITRVEEAKDG